MIVMIMEKTPSENAASFSGEDTFLFAMASPLNSRASSARDKAPISKPINLQVSRERLPR